MRPYVLIQGFTTEKLLFLITLPAVLTAHHQAQVYSRVRKFYSLNLSTAPVPCNLSSHFWWRFRHCCTNTTILFGCCHCYFNSQ